MTLQPNLAFDDPNSRTQSDGLEVVYASAERRERFDMGLFEGFSSMYALTYTPSVPMILGLLRDFDYDDFECIFGHNGILSRDAANLLVFQTVVDEKLNKGFVGISGLSEERRRIIYDRTANGTARFFVVKDAIAHAKIYLLEREGLRRVIVGSANLSESAFSGRQAETLIAFDNDDIAWTHYFNQYEAVRAIATSRLELREHPISADLIPVQETPVLKEASSKSDGVTLYVPSEQEDEAEYSIPKVLSQVERIAPIRRQALADIRPDRKGNIRFVPKIVKQMTRIATSRQDDEGPQTFLSRTGKRFTLSGNEMSLETDPAEVRSDVAAWLEFFGNYENGFVGDVPRLQRDYYTFMCWFYFSPLMCDLRNKALREGNFSFDQPMFAVLYGQSNCGKSILIETLMKSMFAYPRIVETQYFTRRNLHGLQESYKRFPVVFDDVTRDRFRSHAPEVIKHEHIPCDEYPCFALSMNAEARNFPPEIIKRCLMIYTRTSLPGDATPTRRRLQRSVSGISEKLTTALYREYLNRVLHEMNAITSAEYRDVDILDLSSSVLCCLFEENLPLGSNLPDWCKTMTLDEYQSRAFERPRLVLKNLLHRDKYTKDHRPPIGSWTISGDLVIVGVQPMTSSQIKNDIPDWILDDTASVNDQIAMKRNELEKFLDRPVKSPHRLFDFLRQQFYQRPLQKTD